MTSIPAPAPGIHRNIHANDYHRWDAASQSRMKEMLRSPAHCFESMLNPMEQTDAMKVGSAAHVMLFQPETFEDIYHVTERFERRSKEAKQKWEDLVTTYGSEENILWADDFETVNAIVQRVKNHKAAGPILSLCSDLELSMVWEQYGILCKGRLDGYCPELKAVIDLKTTQDASSEEFSRSVYKYGYHRQAAHYIDGARACGLDVNVFITIAVEKVAPFGCSVFQYTDDTVNAGRLEIRGLLEQYRDCKVSGIWPGYPEEVFLLSLPEWALRKFTTSTLEE